MEPLLQVKQLKTRFKSKEGTVEAVSDLSFSLDPNEILAIVGESGCGKSVTALSILRILSKNAEITTGEILFNSDGKIIDLTKLKVDGSEIRSIRGNDIAMIFQEPMTSFSPVHTIGNQIVEAISLHSPVRKKDYTEDAMKILKEVGMPDPKSAFHSYPHNLSGGMRQRAMIAMALSCKPKILIADEPTTAVDVTLQAKVLELMRDMQKLNGMSILLITHDLGVVAEMADRVIVMYLGRAMETAGVEELFENPKHPYTQGLMRSVPKLEGDISKLQSIRGTVPSLYELPVGCKFNTRCDHMIEGVCDQDSPTIQEIGPQHMVACYLYEEEKTHE